MDQPLLRRALILSHFDPEGIVDPHFLFSLAAYREIFSHITVVSTAAQRLPPGFECLADTFITRENTGYDFYSWKIGYNALGEKDSFFEIVFANDSIYGPLFDLRHSLLHAAIKDADFWAMTSSHQIRWHLQSYFFSMRFPMIAAGAAQSFWDRIEPLPSKADVINRYELQMAEKFQAAGWRVSAVFSGAPRPSPRDSRMMIDLRKPLRSALFYWRALRARAQNPMHQSWLKVIEGGVPFIKVELLRTNPLYIPEEPIRSYIARKTRYPLARIEAHAARTHPGAFH